MILCCLPAWSLTGGTSLLTGIRPLAARVLACLCALLDPENLTGLVDQLHSPIYTTSVGLLKMG
jgi:cell division protein FtsA